MIGRTWGPIPALGMALSVLLLAPSAAWAHAFGRIGVDHYIRVTPQREVLQVEYDVHIGELPTAAICARLDVNRNGQIDTDEIAAYVKKATPVYARVLDVLIRGDGWQQEPFLKLPPGPFSDHCVFRLPDGEGGAKTLRIAWTFQAPWPSACLTNAAHPVAVTVSRPTPGGGSSASWVFVTGEPAPPVTILESDVPTDRDLPLPPDITPIEPDVAKIPIAHAANLLCRLDGSVNPQSQSRQSQGLADTTANGPMTIAPSVVAAARGKPPAAQSRIEVSETRLRNRILALLKPPLSRTSKIVLLLLSFLWGAAHAFSPGHGKAIASTYLVSSRATYGQAVMLGLLVTVTHTAIVVVLSIAALILGDRFVYPTWLQPLGAVIVLLVGVRQIIIGLLRAAGIQTHTHHHHHDHHSHDHGAPEKHAHQHDAADGAAHAHQAPVAFRDLAAVGVSGGMVPCPASIVLLLITWQLRLPVLGFFCVFTFSVGLASALIGVGTMAVLGTRTIVRWLAKDDTSHTHRLTIESVVPILGGLLLTVLGMLMLANK